MDFLDSFFLFRLVTLASRYVSYVLLYIEWVINIRYAKSKQFVIILRFFLDTIFFFLAFVQQIICKCQIISFITVFFFFFLPVFSNVWLILKYSIVEKDWNWTDNCKKMWLQTVKEIYEVYNVENWNTWREMDVFAFVIGLMITTKWYRGSRTMVNHKRYVLCVLPK